MKQTNKALKAKISQLEESKKYQGYENAETFHAALIINRSREDYTYYRNMKEEMLNSGRWSERVTSGVWTVEQYALYMVEDAMKDDYECKMEKAVCQITGELYRELLTVAFQQINWKEVAEAILVD